MTAHLIRPSNGLYLKDDFYSNDSVADALLGELRWELVTIGNASTLASQTAPAVGRNGVLRLTTAATANGDGAVLRLFEDGLIVRPNTECAFKFRYVTDVLSNLRLGLDDSVTATEPTKGVWFQFLNGVADLQADSTGFGDNNQLVTGHADLTSGTTLVVATDYVAYFICSGQTNANGGPKEVDFFLGPVGATGRAAPKWVGKVPCALGSAETVELKIAHWQSTGGAAAKVVEIDYAELWVPR